MKNSLIILRSLGVIGAFWLLYRAVTACTNIFGFIRAHPGAAIDEDLVFRNIVIGYSLPLATVAILLLLPYRRFSRPTIFVCLGLLVVASVWMMLAQYGLPMLQSPQYFSVPFVQLIPFFLTACLTLLFLVSQWIALLLQLRTVGLDAEAG